MSFQSLPQLLNSISTQESWRGRQQFQKLLACWLDVVGAAVAAQTRPLGIQRQVLQVATSSAAWAQNLAFERHRIVEKLNQRLTLDLTDIRFSTAHWQLEFRRTGVENASEAVILWREHPSRVTGLPRSLRPPTPRDPQTAFRNWARTVRAQSQHLPLCPCCQSPTPEGELIRWSMCSLCAAQRFGSGLPNPTQPQPGSPQMPPSPSL
jgi:predicted nucleic acid-binding Zn ribbon protein